MTEKNKGKKFTVQGMDTPVPVGVVPSTGPRRPSACDGAGKPNQNMERSQEKQIKETAGVGNQAPRLENATGSGKEKCTEKGQNVEPTSSSIKEQEDSLFYTPVGKIGSNKKKLTRSKTEEFWNEFFSPASVEKEKKLLKQLDDENEVHRFFNRIIGTPIKGDSSTNEDDENPRKSPSTSEMNTPSAKKRKAAEIGSIDCLISQIARTEDENEEVDERRKLLVRSDTDEFYNELLSPMTERRNSCEGRIESPEETTSAKTSKKRKAASSPKLYFATKPVEDDDTSRKIILAGTKMEEMMDYIKKHPTVHLPIKKMIEEMSGIIREIKKTHKEATKTSIKKIKMLEAENEELKIVNRELLDTISRSENMGFSRQVSEQATQTITPEELESETRMIEIENFKRTNLNAKGIRDMMEVDWPQEAYRTDLSSRAITHSEVIGDLVLISDFGAENKNRLLKRMAQGSPKITQLLREENIRYDEPIHYKISGTVGYMDEEELEERYNFFIGLHKEEEETGNRYELLYKALKKLRIECDRRGRRELHIAILGDGKLQNRMRKIIECSMHDFTGKIIIHDPGNLLKNENLVETTRKGTQNPRRRQYTQAIVVEKGNKTYAELLQKVKNEIQDTDVKNKIQTVRETKGGDLLIRLKAGAHESDKTTAYLREKLTGEKIRKGKARGERTQLHISGIDAIATEEEIQDTVRSCCPEVCEEVEVRALRKTARGGTQYAIIIVSEEAAKKLIGHGTIQVGLSCCQVKERITLKTCHRCWETGHEASICKGVDRSKLCRNCGEEGHLAATCTKRAMCPICGTVGHRAGTIKCPKYKQQNSVAAMEEAPNS